MASYCSIHSNAANSTLEISLKGRWTVATLKEIERELASIRFADFKRVTLDGKGLDSFDTSAAWFLDALARRLQGQGAAAALQGFKEGHRKIFERIFQLPHAGEEIRAPVNPVRAFFISAGMRFDDLRKDFYKGVGFFGEFLSGFSRRIFRPAHLRLRSVAFHINEVGIKAVPIISLMAFSIAFVMGYQGAFQLQKFDATVYTVDLVALSILREMGVLITAIMVAGRSGSAFAAQLGTMKLNEEVDALRTMGVAPFEVLVLPRLLAILIALPLLTVIADMMGLLGGYIFSSSYLGYSYVQFISRMQEAVDMKQFYVGLSKAPFFALLIGIVGCMQGLQAQGSAEDVGRRTITAVVQSIFLVIVADAIFSVIFTKLGI